jgi:hypothetical protein
VKRAVNRLPEYRESTDKPFLCQLRGGSSALPPRPIFFFLPGGFSRVIIEAGGNGAALENDFR